MEMSLQVHVLILLVLSNCGLIIGEVTLYPSGTALVCDGGQLEFICSITGNYLQWRIAVPTDDNRTDFNITTRTLTEYTQAWSFLLFSTSLFTFSVISAPYTSLLSSSLLISPVIDNLNGTEVTCCDPLTYALNSSHSATISIMDNSTDSQGFNITSLSEQFESQYVLVTLQLELIMLKINVSYQVAVVPQLNNIVYSERDRFKFQLKVSYDISYNVTVELSQCAATSTATTVLYYNSVGCDHPSAQLNDSHIIIMGYNEISMGITVILSCPTGLVLTGPNSSRCMGNGEWEPNPREAECKVNCGDPPSHPVNGHTVPYTNTLEGAVVTYVCWTVHQEENTSLCTEITTTVVCNNNGIWELDSQDRCSVFSEKASFNNLSKDGTIAVASSVTVFIVTAILFFVAGFLSRYFCQKGRKTDDDHQVVKKEIPIYDAVVLKQQEQELELKENVSYAPVR